MRFWKKTVFCTRGWRKRQRRRVRTCKERRWDPSARGGSIDAGRNLRRSSARRCYTERCGAGLAAFLQKGLAKNLQKPRGGEAVQARRPPAFSRARRPARSGAGRGNALPCVAKGRTGCTAKDGASGRPRMKKAGLVIRSCTRRNERTAGTDRRCGAGLAAFLQKGLAKNLQKPRGGENRLGVRYKYPACRILSMSAAEIDSLRRFPVFSAPFQEVGHNENCGRFSLPRPAPCPIRHRVQRKRSGGL